LGEWVGVVVFGVSMLLFYKIVVLFFVVFDKLCLVEFNFGDGW
jgi:hypothetical protein